MPENPSRSPRSDEPSSPHPEPSPSAAVPAAAPSPAVSGRPPSADAIPADAEATEPPSAATPSADPGPHDPAGTPGPHAGAHHHSHHHLDHRGLPRARTPLAVAALGALGVVFGDIGTSPLYALQTVFALHHNAVAPTESDVLGVVSMVTWCLLTIVTFTYLGLIMRADNQGEGGILALTALVLRKLRGAGGVGPREAAVALVLGVLGAALFFGDSVITPAISVLSAFEGIEVAGSVPNSVILPGALIVLTALFAVQRRGTARIGRLFGPVMIVWFVVLAAMGLPHLLANPSILRALSPHYALLFLVDRPGVAFIALGAVVLAITGAEALYADMGHFGRRPIALAWGALVLPALLLNYYGQGALILADPRTVVNPFFSMVPDALRVPLVALAALATVIASQAVISGAFSVARQATRLSLLPRLKVTQTSEAHGGQIYIGTINTLLFAGVLVLVLVFRRSEALAAAYGLAVTATIILVLALFLLYARRILSWPLWQVVPLAVVVGGLELVLLAANVVKIPAGGWIPLVIAAALTTIMLVWKRGSRILFDRRRDMEGPLAEFIAEISPGGSREVPRVPGLVVYPHGNEATVPLALRTGVAMNRVLHEHVVLLTMKHLGVPHARAEDRSSARVLGPGIVQLTHLVGFHDSQDVPAALAEAVERLGREHGPECDAGCVEHVPELALAGMEPMYVLSVFRIEPGQDPAMPRWQRGLFRTLERAGANRTQVLQLPTTRTVVMGAETEL
ncbi:potassium transporter Kup [Brachybacterium aquaticum]|uniref:Probable potassium transport system protein Kup n=1 Tax=Brachybacterium aquaticum TaxID=1432564 RepID=A0A841A9D8_9MICO|nr:KUP/HAK/KT family potassium transporter [Brachybacterium aquaticum]MBB5830231.1 KUP system potassium uptake protein [Brachybacterium aquaticum]